MPKQYAPESIDPAEAFRLLAEKRAAGPSRRGRRGRGRAASGAKTAKAGKSAKTASSKSGAVAAGAEAKRAERRAKVKSLADHGWANTRIAKELGSTAATVKSDIDWLTANEGYDRPPVVPRTARR